MPGFFVNISVIPICSIIDLTVAPAIIPVPGDAGLIISFTEPYLISNLCGMVPLMIGALKILFFAVFFALSIEDATSFALPKFHLLLHLFLLY